MTEGSVKSLLHRGGETKGLAVQMENQNSLLLVLTDFTY